jgi:hypothetical protein
MPMILRFGIFRFSEFLHITFTGHELFD